MLTLAAWPNPTRTCASRCSSSSSSGSSRRPCSPSRCGCGSPTSSPTVRRASDELAATTDTHPPSLYRLLRAMAYLGLLEETEPGHFGLTDMGTLLRSDDPNSMAAITQLFCGEGVWRSWGDLMAGVQTGKPSYERGIGLEPFTEFAENPEAARNFNLAMSEGTVRDAPADHRVHTTSLSSPHWLTSAGETDAARCHRRRDARLPGHLARHGTGVRRRRGSPPRHPASTTAARSWRVTSSTRFPQEPTPTS